MSQPPDKYERSFDFTDFSATQPSAQQPGQKIDQELNAARESLNDTIDRLGEIQRDDGKLRASALDTTEFNGIVNAATATATAAASSATASAATATTKAGEATTAATTASNAASTATGASASAQAQAAVASSAATTATTKATEASNSAASALASQTSATASAATATTKASEAAGSAANAATSAGNAANSANQAGAQANLAVAAAGTAQNAANSFNLTAGTTTTGAPGSSASVTVTGSAPSYALNITVPAGPAGAAGATGATGAAGAAATISVGTVTTGAAGSSVSITNAGTSSAAVFNFSIPRGDTGATGPQGPAGPGATWGGITGTLSSQSDLNTALAGKAATSHTHTASQISDSTTAGRALLTGVDAAAQRTSLGLGTSAVEPASRLVPPGGLSGQILAKNSSIDYDDAWVTVPLAPVTSVAGKTGAVTLNVVDITGLGTAAYQSTSAFAQVTNNLSEFTATASTARTNLGLGTAAVEPATKLVPAGGTTGQVLAKSSNTDHDDAWITLPSAPVTSVAGKTGAVTLVNTDISGLGTLATINDAPSNGSQYARQNGTWQIVSGGGGGGGLSSAVDIQTFGSPTESGTFTWTKPAGAKMVEFYLWGAGGGGGGGGRFAQTSGRCGGCAGAGGGLLVMRIGADAFGATETVTIAAGGTGGASQTVDSTNGVAGTPISGSITATQFGQWVAKTGQGGNGGLSAVGGSATSGTNLFYGAAVGGVGSPGNSLGAGINGTVIAVSQGGFSLLCPTSGGSGAGASANGTTSQAGGNGGSSNGLPATASQSGYSPAVAGGAGGTSAGVQATNGLSLSHAGYLKGATGGGAGFFINNAAGGNGGNGGWPGGGGGGGGASTNGFASGRGGNGGNGYAVIITYF